MDAKTLSNMIEKVAKAKKLQEKIEFIECVKKDFECCGKISSISISYRQPTKQGWGSDEEDIYCERTRTIMGSNMDISNQEFSNMFAENIFKSLNQMKDNLLKELSDL